MLGLDLRADSARGDLAPKTYTSPAKLVKALSAPQPRRIMRPPPAPRSRPYTRVGPAIAPRAWSNLVMVPAPTVPSAIAAA